MVEPKDAAVGHVFRRSRALDERSQVVDVTPRPVNLSYVSLTMEDQDPLNYVSLTQTNHFIKSPYPENQSSTSIFPLQQPKLTQQYEFIKSPYPENQSSTSFSPCYNSMHQQSEKPMTAE